MRPGARTDVGPPLRFLTSGPSLGFGAWAVGGTGWGAAAAEPERLAAIHRALELGVTFFDTAPTYGDGTSETLLGQALKADRDRVAIATKVGPRDDPRRRSPTQDLLVQRQGVRAPADRGRAARRNRAPARHAAVGARARLGPRTTGRRYRPGGSAQPRAGGAESCRRPTPPTRCTAGGRPHRGGCVPVGPGHGSAQARGLHLGRPRAFHRPAPGWENQRGADRRPVDGLSRDSHVCSASQGVL